MTPKPKGTIDYYPTSTYPGLGTNRDVAIAADSKVDSIVVL